MKQDTKEKIQYGTAVAMVASGIVLTFLSFAVSHAVHSSVLAFVGEAVGFAGGVFGLTMFARAKSAEIDEKFNALYHQLQKLDNHENHQ